MSSSEDLEWIFIGNIVTPEVDGSISVLVDQLLVVNTEGIIVHVGDRLDEQSRQFERLIKMGEIEPSKVIQLENNSDSWILPGFVDTHLHAPQYVNAGIALDKPLMEWLEHYTFKTELEIDKDPLGYGKLVYEKLVQRLIENGTTLVSVFGTISVEANLVLAKEFLKKGLRGQIGKVSMDQNSTIEGYLETTEQSLKETERFIKEMRNLNNELVEPVVTPRFVPTCSKKLLVGLEKLSREYKVRVQSHLAESLGEVELCKQMLNGQSDVEHFHELGLLNDRSIMAHCTHATDSDLDLFRQTGTSISHCPLSNVYFSPERQLPLREALDKGVSVGLGSDISGGYRVGLDDQMRWSVGVSKLRLKPITWKESLYLATLGGAKALGMHTDDHDRRRGRVGMFKVGFSFDAQLIKVGTSKRSRIDSFENQGGQQRDKRSIVEENLEKWWCNGNEVDRKGVWCRGRKIFTNDE